MEVQVISGTVQKFNGESYYLCGNYYQRKGRRLHREVWMYHNGEIPKGYHVHHIDENRHNNSIENLTLMEGAEHLSLHMSTEERKEESREHIKKAIAAAPGWHHSAEGAAWHSIHSKEAWKERKYHKKTCDWCGAEFETRDIGHIAGQHFCCGKHRSLATQWRIRHEGSTDYPHRKG